MQFLSIWLLWLYQWDGRLKSWYRYHWPGALVSVQTHKSSWTQWSASNWKTKSGCFPWSNSADIPRKSPFEVQVCHRLVESSRHAAHWRARPSRSSLRSCSACDAWSSSFLSLTGASLDSKDRTRTRVDHSRADSAWCRCYRINCPSLLLSSSRNFSTHFLWLPFFILL